MWLPCWSSSLLSFSVLIVLSHNMFFVLLIPITFSPWAGHYTLMCSFSPTEITSLWLLVDPEPAEKLFGCYCQSELAEWKGFFFMYVVKEREVQCLMDTSWMDVIYSSAICCADDVCNKTTEVPPQITKQLTAALQPLAHVRSVVSSCFRGLKSFSKANFFFYWLWCPL